MKRRVLENESDCGITLHLILRKTTARSDKLSNILVFSFLRNEKVRNAL
jgi:hypothetical protein